MLSEKRKENMAIVSELLSKTDLSWDEAMLATVDLLNGSLLHVLYSNIKDDQELCDQLDAKFSKIYDSITNYLEKNTDNFIEDMIILTGIVQEIYQIVIKNTQNSSENV